MNFFGFIDSACQEKSAENNCYNDTNNSYHKRNHISFVFFFNEQKEDSSTG